MVSVFATSAGVFAFGWTHDATGGYALALWGSAAAFVLGAVCFAALRAFDRPNPAQ